VATERKTCMSCRLMWWKSTGKGTVTCALLWMKSMILRPGCRGQRWVRYWCMWGCGPAGGQWDNQDGKAAAGSVKDCGVRQGSSLLGWVFLRLVGWQYRKINKTNHILLNVIEISHTGCPQNNFLQHLEAMRISNIRS